MAVLEMQGMQASIAGETVTLTPTAGFSESHPGSTPILSVVVTSSSGSSDFFVAASTGVRYDVTISRR